MHLLYSTGVRETVRSHKDDTVFLAMKNRFRLTRSAVVALAAAVLCLYAVWTLFVPRAPSDSHSGTKCTHRPKICGHRVVGDEAATLGIVPTEAMSKLFEVDVQCFDGDVIRCEFTVQCCL